MARSKNNIVMHGASGRVGKLLVFKTNGDKTYITKRPDRSKVKLSQKQVDCNNDFANAVLFAKEMKKDPEAFTAAGGTVRPRQSVYHAALSWYLTNKPDRTPGMLPGKDSACTKNGKKTANKRQMNPSMLSTHSCLPASIPLPESRVSSTFTLLPSTRDAVSSSFTSKPTYHYIVS